MNAPKLSVLTSLTRMAKVWCLCCATPLHNSGIWGGSCCLCPRWRVYLTLQLATCLLKGTYRKKNFSFTGPIGHNIWWEIVKTARSDLKMSNQPRNRNARFRACPETRMPYFDQPRNQNAIFRPAPKPECLISTSPETRMPDFEA